ncbi:H-type lectin domain-containing protein [Lysinibacter cavernae]|uniref:H-type lectin domain-containing protein n=1 Tax=Lysinibacter cavernae TaxID=1640652 RepID=A0A7X5R127_9MICO|nr:H-type lectin domain-containing protein [Lysinibacter cavernae]NIH53745.1 hypothetical protein [Lysinibacter cavernae]
MQKEFLVNIKGNKGDKGDANTLSIGTVTTAATGVAASASITGTVPVQTLNLTLPRGEKGETGAGQKWDDIADRPVTFPPATHSHTVSQIAGLDSSLNSKAPLTHAHVVSDVVGLSDALAQKASASHAHAATDVVGLDSRLKALPIRIQASAATIPVTAGIEKAYVVTFQQAFSKPPIVTASPLRGDAIDGVRLAVGQVTTTNFTMVVKTAVGGNFYASYIAVEI